MKGSKKQDEHCSQKCIQKRKYLDAAPKLIEFEKIVLASILNDFHSRFAKIRTPLS